MSPCTFFHLKNILLLANKSVFGHKEGRKKEGRKEGGKRKEEINKSSNSFIEHLSHQILTVIGH